MEKNLEKELFLNYFNHIVAKRIQNIHFVGIGGSGMSGIAEVLHNLGFNVTGSELIKNEATNLLSNLGVKIRFSHIQDNVAYCDAIVVSSAVAKDNIELLTAKKRKIPIIHRAEMLAELMRFKYGIAVAGSHGKTTTTSLIATILAEANKDPTFVVGGRLNKCSSNAKLGSGNFFVSEADESDGSFLHLNPLLSVITNIDNDHLINYGNDFNNLKKAFLEFIHRIPFYGLVIVCKDDPVIAAMLDNISRPLLTYGFSEEADLRAINYQQHNNISKFQVIVPTESKPREVILNLPGKHNALNALAAIAVGLELNIDFGVIGSTLKCFHGTNRRFQIHGEFQIKSNNHNKFLLIDDYGHHPKEIEAVITAIKEGWPNRRIVIIFQPHRYSRTQQLWSEFIKVLAMAEHIILLDVYSAGEEKIPDISSVNLCAQIAKAYGKATTLIGQVEEISIEQRLFSKLQEILQDQDVLLTQGAGNIGKLVMKLIEQFNFHEVSKVE